MLNVCFARILHTCLPLHLVPMESNKEPSSKRSINIYTILKLQESERFRESWPHVGPTRDSGGTHVGPTCYSDGTHVGATVLLSEPFNLKKIIFLLLFDNTKYI